MFLGDKLSTYVKMYLSRLLSFATDESSLLKYTYIDIYIGLLKKRERKVGISHITHMK